MRNENVFLHTEMQQHPLTTDRDDLKPMQGLVNPSEGNVLLS